MSDATRDERDEQQPKLLQLNEIEARVLGALMEKEYATPEAYPLTQNSLTTACNQKSSREPVMDLSPGEVGHTLRQLEARGLVGVDSGARSERYMQKLSHALSLNDKRQALICLLLLRGPQTLGELLNRSNRLAQFKDTEDVRLSVLKLIERPQPLLKQLARQSGQREDRYAHLLCGEPSVPEPVSAVAQRKTASGNERTIDELLSRVESLELAMAELKQKLGLKNENEASADKQSE
ncbi:MAG: YceH family protein [Granulosicoccaceae bacterium]